MPPLPGVLAMMAPPQSASKSLSATASTTTVTTEVAGSRYENETTARNLPKAISSKATKSSSSAATTCVTTSFSNSTAVSLSSTTTNSTNADSCRNSSSGGRSKKTCNEASSSSSNVDDVINTASKDRENSEAVNNDTDSEISSNIFGRPQEIFLKNVNPHITCNLCKGYLIDATTIVECLHSFCHSCIMNHLRKDQYCPRCEMMINTAKPNNIKSDTTLQAIVYKLVPGLYEKELLRKRAFYCTRPKEAMLATPEQRGEDTEHLIFGPTENMSLSLEYADIEETPTHNTFELSKPKFLKCPAIFTVSNLKKFVYGKFGIDHNRFSIEIMYKVKTIVLADHYKIMDVAYIYTWKRDAPMRFFFRVKEDESALRKRREIKKETTSEEVALPQPTVESSPVLQVETASVDSVKSKEIKIEIKEETNDGSEPKIPEIVAPIPVVESLPPVKEENEPKNEKPKPIEIKKPLEKGSPDAAPYKSDKPSPDPRTEKLKITLVNKGKSCSKDDESPKSKSNSKTGKTSKHHSPHEHDDRKVENIKLKIDLSKQGSVTIINMSSSDPLKKEVVKPLKAEKEWKIKVKKDLKTNGSKDEKVPSITIELDKPTTSSAIREKSIAEKEKEEEEKKSEFLNSIALAPIKSINSPEKLEKQNTISSLTPSLPPSNFSTKKFFMPPPLLPPPSAVPKVSASAKRKSKEPLKIVAKKPKLDEPKPKPQTSQIKVRSNLISESKTDAGLSYKLGPFPIGLSSSPSEINKKQEDEKLMPAPPPLKMLDSFKKNGAAKTTKVSKSKPQAKQVKGTSDGFLRPMVTTSLTNSKVPIISNVMGNRTPIARRYPPILPKSPRVNPFANIPTDVNKYLSGPATEIKPIQNSDNKEIKVYGPPTTTANNQKQNMPPPSSSSVVTSAPSKQQQNSPATPRPTTKTSTTSNYLNYAIFNASKTKMSDVPLGCRTPIYTPNSPIYSPNSPQYMPNYNIPVQPTYKYTKSQTNVGNYLQNVFGPNKQMSNLFPSPPTKAPVDSLPVNRKSDGDENSFKRTKTPPSTGKASPEPSTTDKQTPVQSLLNSCNINIPSSLSITITNENSDSNSNSSTNPKHNNPVNNYIEILKLPDSPVSNEQPNSVPSSPDNKTSNQSKKTASGKPSFTINPPKSSPSAISIPASQPKPALSPSPTPAKIAEIDKKLLQAAAQTQKPPKKTPSPEKKIVEKPVKKAQGEKRPASDPIKSASKDKTDTPPKKYRPILPRSKTPPNLATTSTLQALSSKLHSKVPAAQPKPASTNSKKPPPKSQNSTSNKSAAPLSVTNFSKKPETVVDLTSPQKTTSPGPSTSRALPTPAIQPDLHSFLQQLKQAQSLGSPTSNNMFLPHLAAAASFNPASYPAVNFGYNLQYLMENYSRMQKAGSEVVEIYMQRLKNNNTSCAKSPTGSPGSNTSSTGSGSDVKNSV